MLVHCTTLTRTAFLSTLRPLAEGRRQKPDEEGDGMRFSDNGYYIERYVKCDNCGVLIYDEGISATVKGKDQLFCSDWCVQWFTARANGVEQPRIPLPKQGIHETG